MIKSDNKWIMFSSMSSVLNFSRISFPQGSLKNMAADTSLRFLTFLFGNHFSEVEMIVFPFCREE